MHYGADVQWLAVRQRDFDFAAKAGHNDEPHNHNDLGSFIYAKNGRQVLKDPGRAQYCRDYFREDTRYGFLHTGSRGHSVPLVAGQYQILGREAAAEDVCWDGKCFSMELKRAYAVPELKSLRRSFTAGEKGVVLADSFDCAASVTERFVAAEAPVAEPGKLVFSDTVLTFTPEVSPYVERVEETVEGGKTQVLYLVDIPLPEGTELFSCQIE